MFKVDDPRPLVGPEVSEILLRDVSRSHNQKTKQQFARRLPPTPVVCSLSTGRCQRKDVTLDRAG